jgi:predicted nucleic acid-binding protein
LEVANAFRSAIRRKRCDEVFADEAFTLLRRMVVEVDGETHQRAWGETLRLSRKHGLTPYDAAYLELALRHQGVLATVDSDLKIAASAYDLEIVG